VIVKRGGPALTTPLHTTAAAAFLRAQHLKYLEAAARAKVAGIVS